MSTLQCVAGRHDSTPRHVWRLRCYLLSVCVCMVQDWHTMGYLVNHDQPLRPLEEIGNQWFVNRQKELDLFWEWGNSIPLGGRHSIAFAGLRRTGKTAILHRAFNRLFYEQQRVLPIFMTFESYLYRAELITTYEFARDYLSGYLRSYFAFRYRRPEFHRDLPELGELEQFAEDFQDEIALKLFNSYGSIGSHVVDKPAMNG
ncbi:hypothetical protein KFU94_43705 [Chloroflexi bacterium TSY]|nr:hypothetical protein [Chloroflexi bacterium TSY]